MKEKNFGWSNNHCYRASLFVDSKFPCHGNESRGICVAEVEDLPRARKKPCLLVSKFGTHRSVAGTLCQIKELQQIYKVYQK
jgi:hypothetical protein